MKYSISVLSLAFLLGVTTSVDAFAGRTGNGAPNGTEESKRPVQRPQRPAFTLVIELNANQMMLDQEDQKGTFPARPISQQNLHLFQSVLHYVNNPYVGLNRDQIEKVKDQMNFAKEQAADPGYSAIKLNHFTGLLQEAYQLAYSKGAAGLKDFYINAIPEGGCMDVFYRTLSNWYFSNLYSGQIGLRADQTVAAEMEKLVRSKAYYIEFPNSFFVEEYQFTQEELENEIYKYYPNEMLIEDLYKIFQGKKDVTGMEITKSWISDFVKAVRIP